MFFICKPESKIGANIGSDRCQILISDALKVPLFSLPVAQVALSSEQRVIVLIDDHLRSLHQSDYMKIPRD
jgi:hypothetical protein